MIRGAFRGHGLHGECGPDIALRIENKAVVHRPRGIEGVIQQKQLRDAACNRNFVEMWDATFIRRCGDPCTVLCPRGASLHKLDGTGQSHSDTHLFSVLRGCIEFSQLLEILRVLGYLTEFSNACIFIDSILVSNVTPVQSTNHADRGITPGTEGQRCATFDRCHGCFCLSLVHSP
jgi:hypothetical protein